MKGKLTLSIDKEKIKLIKRYSKKNGHSVSQLIENVIDKIGDTTPTKKLDIMTIKGAFGKASKNLDWKEIKSEYLIKKYVK